MTCIAGLVHEGKVYIGGDSAGVAGYYLTVRADAKVFRNGPFLMGFTSSFRMGQLLHYKLRVPAHHPDTDIYEYMVTTFIDTVRQCLRDGGYATNDKGEESGGTFLVGYRGRLFEINSDYQVGEALDGYAAVGCGGEVAQGVMFATIGDYHSPEDRIRLALEAAERHSVGVRRPFRIEVLESEEKV